MQGKRLPVEYGRANDVGKGLEEVYEDLNGYTCELDPAEPWTHHNLDFAVLVPPLEYEGTFLKGLYYSQGVDLIQQRFPYARELFRAIANSMWCAYPRARQADAYFTGYKNERYEAYMRRTRPYLAGKPLLPFHNADFTNEYLCAPTATDPIRDIDVLLVSTLSRLKNVPLVAAALKVFRAKYPDWPIKLTWIIGQDLSLNYRELDAAQRQELREVEKVLVHVWEYIEIVPRVPYPEMMGYYSRAKVAVLGSLVGGKNRSLNEAMCCNTPVVCFRDFNKYVRDDEPIFPDGAGELADFKAEALADALFKVLSNPDGYMPRRRYLETRGRRRVFDQLVEQLDDYAETIPDYQPGRCHESLWLDLATQHQYQLGFHDFLYDKHNGLSHPIGIERVAETLAYYRGKFSHRLASS